MVVLPWLVLPGPGLAVLGPVVPSSEVVRTATASGVALAGAEPPPRPIGGSGVSRETVSGPGQPNGVVARPERSGKPSPGATDLSSRRSTAVLIGTAFRRGGVGLRHPTSPFLDTPTRHASCGRVRPRPGRRRRRPPVYSQGCAPGTAVLRASVSRRSRFHRPDELRQGPAAVRAVRCPRSRVAAPFATPTGHVHADDSCGLRGRALRPCAPEEAGARAVAVQAGRAENDPHQ